MDDVELQLLFGRLKNLETRCRRQQGNLGDPTRKLADALSRDMFDAMTRRKKAGGESGDLIEALRTAGLVARRIASPKWKPAKAFTGMADDHIAGAVLALSQSLGIDRRLDSGVVESLDARAVAIKVAHPEWSDSQVASAIGCRRTTLYKPNMVNYKRAKEALKTGKEAYQNGVKSDRQRRPSAIDHRDRREE